MDWRMLVFYPEPEAHNLCCQWKSQSHLLIVLQMENCLDGFNVPREHTAKLYIVEKRIMGSIGKFCSYE